MADQIDDPRSPIWNAAFTASKWRAEVDLENVEGAASKLILERGNGAAAHAERLENFYRREGDLRKAQLYDGVRCRILERQAIKGCR